MITPLEQTFIEVVSGELWRREPYAVCPECSRGCSAIPAAMLLGALKERNGCTIEEIVTLARRTVDESVREHEENPRCRWCSRRREYWNVSPAESHDCTPEGAPAPFNEAAFFRAIAREALGEGEVSEEFGEIALPVKREDGCEHCGCVILSSRREPVLCEPCEVLCSDDCDHRWPEGIRPFSVPRLTKGAITA